MAGWSVVCCCLPGEEEEFQENETENREVHEKEESVEFLLTFLRVDYLILCSWTLYKCCG